MNDHQAVRTSAPRLRTTILLATPVRPARRDRRADRRPAARPLLFLGIALRDEPRLLLLQRQDRAEDEPARSRSTSREAPRLYQIVRELTTRAELPMPRLYMIPQDQPNAFATGRNPKHSAVAVTARHHQAALRGRAARRARPRARPHPQPRHPDPVGRRGDRRARSPTSPTCCCGSAATTTVAARPGRLAGDGPAGADRGDRSSSSSISRQREYAADAGGAEICGNPESLAERAAAPRGGRARRCRCRSTRRPSRSTSSSRSRGGASPASSRPTRRSRSGSAGCARCAPPSASVRSCVSTSLAILSEVMTRETETKTRCERRRPDRQAKAEIEEIEPFEAAEEIERRRRRPDRHPRAARVPGGATSRAASWSRRGCSSDEIDAARARQVGADDPLLPLRQPLRDRRRADCEELGYENVASMDGGILAWQEQGLPVVAAEGADRRAARALLAPHPAARGRASRAS